MPANKTTVTPPGYQPRRKLPELLSESARVFRRAILGLGERLQLRGREDMLCGKRRNPMEYMTELYAAGQRAGLPKSWALELIQWQRELVAELYADDRTPVGVLEVAEEKAEGGTNLARLRWQQNPTPENWQSYVDLQRAETAAEEAMLSGYGVPAKCH